jgi:hypothetical protein
MQFCHLGRAQSLREICGGLAASEGKLRQLGQQNCQPQPVTHPGDLNMPRFSSRSCLNSG